MRLVPRLQYKYDLSEKIIGGCVCVRVSICKSFLHAFNKLLSHLSVRRVICKKDRKRFKASVMTPLSSTLNANSAVAGFYPRRADANRHGRASWPPLTHTQIHTHALAVQRMISSGCTTLANSSSMLFTSSPTGSHTNSVTHSHGCKKNKNFSKQQQKCCVHECSAEKVPQLIGLVSSVHFRLLIDH